MSEDEVISIVDECIKDIQNTSPLAHDAQFIDHLHEKLGRRLTYIELNTTYQIYEKLKGTQSKRVPYMGFVDIALDKIAGVIGRLNDEINTTPKNHSGERAMAYAKLEIAREIFDTISDMK